MENLTLSTGNNLTIDVKPIVSIKNSISIACTDTELPVEIVADFTGVPQHLHGIYLSALDSKYNSNVKIFRNEEPKTIEEKKRDWRLNKLADIFTSIFK
jgi:hypothetical protein